MDVPERLDPKKLIAFSGEHLYYEIWMFYGVAELLKPEHKPKYMDDVMSCSLLESFVLHGSIILDFFYKPAVMLGDARAFHYMKNVKKWKTRLPQFDSYIRKFNQRRNKELVHLTYKRMNVKPEDKLWDAGRILRHIKQLVGLFLEHADPALLDPKIYELKHYGAKN
jgi:hypothetical protein